MLRGAGDEDDVGEANERPLTRVPNAARIQRSGWSM